MLTRPLENKSYSSHSNLSVNTKKNPIECGKGKLKSRVATLLMHLAGVGLQNKKQEFPKKVKYLPHLLSNHRNFFSESSYGKYLQVLKKINLIQPSGELRGQHLGEFQQRTSKLFDMDSISLFINVP